MVCGLISYGLLTIFTARFEIFKWTIFHELSTTISLTVKRGGFFFSCGVFRIECDECAEQNYHSSSLYRLQLVLFQTYRLPLAFAKQSNYY